MKPLLVTTLAITLIIQLITMQASLPMPAHSFGSPVSIATVPESIHQSTTYLPARYAMKNNRDEFGLDYQSIVFVGDVFLGRNVEVLNNRYGVDYPFAGLSLTDLAPSPAVFANFESAIAKEHKMTPAYTMKFSTNPAHLTGLQAAGFTHFSLANNHSLDYFQEGYEETVHALEANGFVVIGCQNSHDCIRTSLVELPTATVAVVALEAVASTLSKEIIDRELRFASKVSDVQVAYIHWGEEYVENNSRQQRSLAEHLVASGIDLIIGHHPHVVQNIDFINGVPVVYSLGNYVFDQYFSESVQTGLVVSLELYPEPVLRLVPVTSMENLSQPQLLEGDDKATFLYKLGTHSDPQLSAVIASGAIKLPHWLATRTKTAMMNVHYYVY